MDLERLKKLAGVNEFKGYQEYSLENISKTASEKKAIEKKKNIKPGDPDWFKLWFSLPHMTGGGFRGRTK
ncbi:MAG: hypothetical protein CMA64_10915 [Euryarchaeota archaeon]|nr:hypothetical protein [Euryarchaeota archaeon]|tara:strand:+ start:263 stop:472 length:210 start_codon:yes stop_codon:yes gene_type:complete